MDKPNRPYLLLPYDESWPLRFQAIADEIKSCLGDNVLGVEHIGSTSIPGMMAKPQIDVLVLVRLLKDVSSGYQKMETLGYTPRGNYTKIGEEYFTKDDEGGVRLASIHVLEKGHSEIVPILAFRDYLRENKEDRDLYMNTKKDLYEKYPHDYLSYDSGKKEVIEEIRKHALDSLRLA